MHRARLYVNIDHIATVRQARRTDEPDPVEAATLAEAAGADGITAHLREDRRHIQDDDIERLARSVRTVLNLELALSTDILELACRLRPGDDSALRALRGLIGDGDRTQRLEDEVVFVAVVLVNRHVRLSSWWNGRRPAAAAR